MTVVQYARTLASTPRRQRPNTRGSRVTKSSRDDTHAVLSRPQGFNGWWAWGVSQAQTICSVAPLAINSRNGDRDDWGASVENIRGMPFTRAFEGYVSRERDFQSGPFTRAASHLYARSGPQTDEFRVAFALMSGHTDADVACAVLFGRYAPRPYFEDTAVRALSLMYDKIQSELLTVVDPPAPAGAA
jgi:hypothetical protein